MKFSSADSHFLKVTLYLRADFSSLEKSKAFFDRLYFSELFVPSRFGTIEPIQKKFSKETEADAIEKLSGYPKHLAGGLLLEGDYFQAHVSWKESRKLIDWSFSIDQVVYQNEQLLQKLLDFIAQLCDDYSVIYGTAHCIEDWNSQHKVITDRPGVGTSEKKFGTEILNGLPTMSWLTIFGPQLVSFFGEEKINNLPQTKIISLKKGGKIVLLYPTPDFEDQATRMSIIKEATQLLGSQYFFDIQNPQKENELIEGVNKFQ